MDEKNQFSNSRDGYSSPNHQVERLDPKTEKEWRSLADQVIESRRGKRYTSSNDVLLKAAERNKESPASPAFQLWIADNFSMDQNYNEAIRAYDHCIHSSQATSPLMTTQDLIAGALNHKGQLFHLKGDYVEAIHAFQELFRHRPQEKFAALQAGLIAEQIRNNDLALELYDSIASNESSANTDDPSQLARRCIERVHKSGASYSSGPAELADRLTHALEKQDMTQLKRLICISHFAIGPVGGHTGFETPEMFDKFLEDLKAGNIKVKRMLLGSGSKRYIPTQNWKGQYFQGEVTLIITQAPGGWQWTGVALHQPHEYWINKWRPSTSQTNDPLPFRLKAPWPKDQCFTAGGLWEYVGEQAGVLAAGPFAPLVAAGLATGCCGWGPRGYYYNSGPTHDEEDAFAIDFTRYRQYVPYDNESGGTPVLAASDGIVSMVRAGVANGNSSMANLVQVHHADPGNPADLTRFTSRYLHLEGPFKIPVSEGMPIRVGTRLGLMDDTGNSILDHLHFSIHDRQLPYPGAAEGRSVRPTPMSGVTLSDSDSNKCVKSDNIEYTGTNQMIYPQSYAGQNWLIIPVGLAANQQPPSIANQKWLMVLTGVAIINFKGNGSQWLRETLHLLPDIIAPMNYAINSYGIPIPATTQGYTLQFQVEQWAPHATPSSIFNKDHSVNSGFAVDAWRPNPFFTDMDVVSNQPIHNCFTGIKVDIAVSDIDAYFYRISYHISLIGKIRFGKPIIIL